MFGLLALLRIPQGGFPTGVPRYRVEALPRCPGSSTSVQTVRGFDAKGDLIVWDAGPPSGIYVYAQGAYETIDLANPFGTVWAVNVSADGDLIGLVRRKNAGNATLLRVGDAWKANASADAYAADGFLRNARGDTLQTVTPRRGQPWHAVLTSHGKAVDLGKALGSLYSNALDLRPDGRALVATSNHPGWERLVWWQDGKALETVPMPRSEGAATLIGTLPSGAIVLKALGYDRPGLVSKGKGWETMLGPDGLPFFPSRVGKNGWVVGQLHPQDATSTRASMPIPAVWTEGGAFTLVNRIASSADFALGKTGSIQGLSAMALNGDLAAYGTLGRESRNFILHPIP